MLWIISSARNTPDYARLEKQTRLQKTEESLQEYATKIERLANLAFSDYPANVLEIISLQYFVDELKDREIQRATRMADVQDLKSALLYALKLETTIQASRRSRHSIQRARVTADVPSESLWINDIGKLRDEIQALMAQHQNQEKCNFKCWACSGTTISKLALTMITD
ncbi:uncharacterized protein TNCV_2105261 [Trichonephila clavipes]|nr:uncharacterized protein TNCV_2105261 [Trichonephila clavipes]